MTQMSHVEHVLWRRSEGCSEQVLTSSKWSVEILQFQYHHHKLVGLPPGKRHGFWRFTALRNCMHEWPLVVATFLVFSFAHAACGDEHSKKCINVSAMHITTSNV